MVERRFTVSKNGKKIGRPIKHNFTNQIERIKFHRNHMNEYYKNHPEKRHTQCHLCPKCFEYINTANYKRHLNASTSCANRIKRVLKQLPFYDVDF